MRTGQFRRTLAMVGIGLGLALTASVGGLAQADPPNAPEVPGGRCPDWLHSSVPGGEATWNLRCSGSKLYLDGWVKDTAADGKCARVTAIIGRSGERHAKACTAGTTTNFHWSGEGNSAQVRLYVS